MYSFYYTFESFIRNNATRRSAQYRPRSKETDIEEVPNYFQ